MPPPAARTHAATTAPPAVKPAARPSATRAAAPRRLTGKPAVRLPGVAPRPKGAAKTPAPEPPSAAAARTDPRLQAALAKVKKNATKAKDHRPAAEKVAEAHLAAKSPKEEPVSLAQAAKVEEIKSAEGKPPEEKSFLELLEDEIEKVMPKTIEDTESFMGEEDKKNFKGSMTGNIETQKQAATGDIRKTTQSPPDPSGIPAKPTKGLPPEALPAPALVPVGARDAMPVPRPAEEVSLQSSKDEVDRQFTENKITDAQLVKANDPRFTAVLDAKVEVNTHADAGPQRFREGEQKMLATAADRAAGAERRGAAGMRETRGTKGGAVKSRQELAAEHDEARRKAVAAQIEKFFGETKVAVEGKLATLETEVTKMFDDGLEKAIKDMKKETGAKKSAWKRDRYYSYGIFRPDKWAYDKLKGIEHQPRIKKIYVEAAEEFTRDMKTLVRAIAAHVEKRLKEAKDEVEKGRKRINHYVEVCLPDDLKEVGRAAEKEVSERFDELKQGIEDKKRDLAQSLAQRYKDAHDKAGEAIKEMQAEDKGLVKAFLDKLKEIVEILRNFKRRVMGMLRKAANAIDLIVSDPIGFLGNLLDALKQGVGQFVDHIVDHLREGFMAWLFGSLTKMGVKIPKDLSLPSLLQLVLDVMGLTVDKLRDKVAKVIGERNMALLVAAYEAVETLIKEGPAALWEKIKEYFSNLKEMVVDAMQEWLIGQIIKSAAIKLAMMFNPVGAIIQAIMMIYRTVMFFIENIDKILDFVEAVIESVYNIATGAIGAAADWIEKALARTVPIIIGFLARLLGISGIADKIKGFIQKAQTRVDKALDKVIEKIVGGLKKLIGAGKAIAGKIFEWWKARKKFKADDGQTHTLYYAGTGPGARLTVASDPTEIEDFISRKKKAVNALGDKTKKANLTTKVIPAAETKLTEIKSAEAALKKADVGSGTARKAKATNDNQIYYDTLEAKLEDIKPLLAQLIFKEKDYPPMRLPTYADNVVPKRARADYIDKDRIKPHRISGDTNVNQHKGHLEGWEQLSMAGLTTTRAPYVRMHLFTHRFGGQPTDSNLVPAEGPTANRTMTSFEDHVDKEIEAGKTIWYEVEVTLGNSVNIPPPYRPAFNTKATQKYLSALSARWGTYTLDPGGGSFTEKVESPSVAKTMTAPVFPAPGTVALPSIQDMGKEALVTVMGAPFTEWQMRGFREAVGRLKDKGIRATSVTNLDKELRALKDPYVMDSDMRRKFLDLVHGGKLSI